MGVIILLLCVLLLRCVNTISHYLSLDVSEDTEAHYAVIPRILHVLITSHPL